MRLSGYSAGNVIISLVSDRLGWFRWLRWSAQSDAIYRFLLIIVKMKRMIRVIIVGQRGGRV